VSEFDAAYVGYMLRRFVEVLTGDVRDLPLWRRLVVETMTGWSGSTPTRGWQPDDFDQRRPPDEMHQAAPTSARTTTTILIPPGDREPASGHGHSFQELVLHPQPADLIFHAG
jgi:hypothetical protein